MRSFITTITCLFLMMMTSAGYAAKAKPVCQDYDVFVMRHLEKEKGEDKNPGLSQKGKASAQRLANLAVMKKVTHGFHTPYKRTEETLAFLDIEKFTYEPRQVAELVNNIQQNFCGETVLIVGHSNTVPAIIKAFGGRFSVTYAGQRLAKEPTVTLDENDYGSIFRITFHNERLHQQLYHLNHYSENKKLP